MDATAISVQPHAMHAWLQCWMCPPGVTCCEMESLLAGPSKWLLLCQWVWYQAGTQDHPCVCKQCAAPGHPLVYVQPSQQVGGGKGVHAYSHTGAQAMGQTVPWSCWEWGVQLLVA